MKIVSKDGLVTVYIMDKIYSDTYDECFKLQADLSYEKFFFMSAVSGKAINNHHYIHSVSATNLDEQVDRE